MARIERGNSGPVYAAMARWVDVALRKDDSLFTPREPVWTLENLEELKRRFIDQPDASKTTFLQKLTKQLHGAPRAVVQLMAEVLYVHFVIAHKSAIGGDKKRETLQTVLSWSPRPVALPEDLSRALDIGLVHPGQAYNQKRPQCLEVIIKCVLKFKQLPEAEREQTLADPWWFKAFVMQTDATGAFAQREALLHIVFPDVFEAVTSQQHKQDIAAAFDHLVTESSDDVDRKLLEIRKSLDAEHGRTLSFYESPLEEMWKGAVVTEPPPPPVETGPADIDKRLLALADELLLDAAYLHEVRHLLGDKRQVVFYGPPGTGKTYVAKRLAEAFAGDPARVSIVQFHASYAYEDFVEGIRPRLDGAGTGFRLHQGPLKRLAQRATADPSHTYVLIIDELNRGNVAKVFGELYFLLEYREDAISLQYSEDEFRLPDNLWIIATMNTADRSIALVDLALRRRFHFVAFFPDEAPVEGLLGRWLGKHHPALSWLADVVDQANKDLGERDVAIGPSYFMRPDLTEKKIERIWRHSVLPYVAEHLFGQHERQREFELAAVRRRLDAPAEAADAGDDDVSA